MRWKTGPVLVLASQELLDFITHVNPQHRCQSLILHMYSSAPCHPPSSPPSDDRTRHMECNVVQIKLPKSLRSVSNQIPVSGSITLLWKEGQLFNRPFVRALIFSLE